MTFIVLTATHTNADSKYGRGLVKISKEEYSLCDMFHKFKHEFIKQEKGNIEIRKDTKRGTSLTIKPDTSHEDNILEFVEVYFNKNDNKNEYPLVLVLNFKNEGKETQNKYYKLSNINDELGSSQNLKDIPNYNSEKDIINPLLEENDKIKTLLTYQLDKKIDTNYNDGKITLTIEDVKEKDSDSSNEFKKYIHKPKDFSRNNKSYFLYNKQVLKGINQSAISEVDGNNYYVYVYWSLKVGTPLLIQFTLSNEGTGLEVMYFDYYITRNDNTGIYFEKLTDKTKELGEISTESASNIYDKLTQNDNQVLIVLLKILESKIIKKLFIMVDKHQQYSLNDVQGALKDFSKHRLINNNISVSDKTDTIGVCLKESGFKVIEHDFKNDVKDVISDEFVQLKFMMPCSYSTNYSELCLYKNHGAEDEKDTLYYKQNQNNLYVYFYGEDPRPLLLCYAGSAYKPKDKDNYFDKWYKDENINHWKCLNDKDDSQLLMTISNVLGFLNTVQLSQKPFPSRQIDQPNTISQISFTYCLQNYNNKKIEIKISHSNLNCFKVYTHTPNGIDGKGQGYRLGKIVYENEKNEDNGLNYSLSKNLTEVSVLYNVYDYYHKFPLLVVLKFGKQEIEYYKLTTKIKPYKWQKINDSYTDNIENLALNIKKELNVSFSDNYENKYLFYPKDCKDESNGGAVAGTLTTLGLAGVGTGIAYYKYPELFASLYRRILRWIPVTRRW